MNFAALPENLERVREEIALVQQQEGLSGDVRIVAVTKAHSAEAVRAAHAAGLPDIGENRVQEAMGKQDALGDLPVRWHLIGHLQTNKAKYVPGRFSLVHSVDSVRVAQALQRAAERCEGSAAPLGVLVQVNVAREAQKTGCHPDEVGEIAALVAELSALELRGLMTMAPLIDDERVQREVFGGLRRLRDSLRDIGYRASELSMGMSNDYRPAVAEGATVLRLGTVLFGERAA